MKRAIQVAVGAAVGGCLLGAVACGGGGAVKLGAVLPLSGSSEVYGEALKKGIDLAMNGASEAGLPVAVEMEIKDSASDPAQAAGALSELFTAGAIAVIGGVTSEEALAMVPIAEDAGRVLLSPTASSPRLSGISRSFLRIFPTSDDEAVAIANHAWETLDTSRVIVVAERTAFGVGLEKSFEEKFGVKGGTVVGAIEFDPGNTTVISAQIDEIVSSAGPAENSDKPGLAVYIAAAGPDLADAIHAVRASTFKGRLLASSALASPEVLAAAGDDAETVYFAQTVFDPTSSEEPMASFVRAFEEEYGKPPDFYAAHGYDAVQVFFQALREAGGKTLPSDFRNGMRAIQNLPAVTGSIQFRESGDVQRFMRVYLISEGKPIDFEEYMATIRDRIKQRQQELEQRRKELERKLRDTSG